MEGSNGSAYVLGNSSILLENKNEVNSHFKIYLRTMKSLLVGIFLIFWRIKGFDCLDWKQQFYVGTPILETAIVSSAETSCNYYNNILQIY